MEILEKKQKTQLVDNVTGKVGKEICTLEYYRDKKNLYFNFECTTYKESYTSYGEKYNDKLWKGDVVEVFITLGIKNHYLELETNPNGLDYAVIVDNKDGVGDIDLTYIDRCYSSNVQVKNMVWSTSMILPIANLEKLGYVNSDAAINFYRQSYFGEEANQYSYSPTKIRQFHVSNAFEKVVIK